MVRRLLLGIVKGLAVGGAIGAALYYGAGVSVVQSWLSYLLYGAVAALAGVAAGQAPWKEGAWVASILKAIFGFGVGAGLYALASHFLRLPVGGLAGLPNDAVLSDAPLLFAPAVASVYSTLVELDDGGDQPAQAAQPKTGVRVASAFERLDAIDVGEDVSETKQQSQRGQRAKR